jgi:hypothetical protein
LTPKIDIFGYKACFKKPVLLEKTAFNLPAGFFNETWVFQALVKMHTRRGALF